MQIWALLLTLYETSSKKTLKKAITSYAITLKIAENRKGYIASLIAYYILSF
jgi:hypothetical protein